MLSISPSGNRITPWYLSGPQSKVRQYITNNHHKDRLNKIKKSIPCSALACTASQTCFVMSKSVSFDAATSSARITCQTFRKFFREKT